MIIDKYRKNERWLTFEETVIHTFVYYHKFIKNKRGVWRRRHVYVETPHWDEVSTPGGRR